MESGYKRIGMMRLCSTSDEFQNYFQLNACCICHEVPLPPVRDKSNKIYCKECQISFKIDANTIASDLEYLKNIIIDCKNGCGDTFVFENLRDLTIHESKCKSTPKSEPIGEQNDANSVNTYYNPGNVLKKIDYLNNRFDKFGKEIEDKFYIFMDQLNEVILSNKSNTREISNLTENQIKFNVDADNKLETAFKKFLNDSEKINQSNKVNILSQIEDKFKTIENRFVKVDTLSEIEEKFKSIENRFLKVNILSEIEEKFKSIENRFVKVHALIDEKLNEKDKRKQESDQFDSEIKLNKKNIYSDQDKTKLIGNTDEFKNKIQKLNKNIKNPIQTDNTIILDSLLLELSSIVTSNENVLNQSSIETINRVNQLNTSTILFGNTDYIIPKAHNSYVYSMVIHKNKFENKDLLITGSVDSIKFWNLNDKKTEGFIGNPHVGKYDFLVINDILISAGFDKMIKFWDIVGKKLGSMNIDAKSPISTMIKNDDESIIVGTEDGSIKFYNIHTKALIKKIESNHIKGVLSLMKLNIADKDYLVSGSKYDSLKVWLGDKLLTSLINENISELHCIIELNCKKNFVTADSTGIIVFYNSENFTTIKSFNRNDYIEFYNDEECKINLLELKNEKMMISTTFISTLSFWNLLDFQIVRNLRLQEGLYSILKNHDEGLIFNIYDNIVFWK